jgi:hypothetical protein
MLMGPPVQGRATRGATFGGRQLKRVPHALVVVLAGSSAACGGSDSKSDGAAPGETAGGSLQGSGSASNSTDPTCNIEGGTWQRLPGKDISSLRVVGNDVYYGHDGGVSRVALGDRTGAGAKVLVEGSNRLYLTNTDIVTYRTSTATPPGELVLFPIAGGEPSTQPVKSSSAVRSDNFGRDPILFGSTSFRPFTYFLHDLATGQSEEFVTELAGSTTDEMLVGADAIFVNVSGTREEPSSLYRIDKKGGAPVRLETGIALRTELLGVDTGAVYLAVEDRRATGGAYRLPLTGGGPAVKLPLNLSYSTLLYDMSVTEAGTLLASKDALERGLFRVGPNPADATTPVQLLDTYCQWQAAWSDAGYFYAAVEPNDDEYWLLQMPIASLPQP